MALGFDLRASHLLGRHSYHLSHSTSPDRCIFVIAKCYRLNVCASLKFIC
jgi:hypothetical protein